MTCTTTSGSKRCACGKTISANKLSCQQCGEVPRPEPTGCLEILNVQGGDVKITFDKDNVSETIRARRIVADMLRRGFALIVEIERNGVKAYERVKEFDEARGEYIICDFDSFEAAKADTESAEVAASVAEQKATETSLGAECDCGRPKGHRGACRGPRKRRRLAMESTKATGIGPSAGG